MSSKPTFVLVPGAWHRPVFFAQIRAYLSERGYPSVAVTTPTVGSDPPATTMQGDIDAVEAAVRKVLDGGDDVVLLMHSYGGGPGSAAAGRIAEEKIASGPRGGGSGGAWEGKGRIKRLIYVAAFVPIEGQPLGSPEVVVPEFVPDFLDFNENGSTKFNEKAMVWMYDGLPEEEQRRQLEATTTHPMAPLTELITHAGWRYIPSTAVYATRDKPVPLPFTEFMVKRAQSEEARPGGVRAFTGKLGEVYMDCGHCAMFLLDEKVKELGEIIVAAAEES